MKIFGREDLGPVARFSVALAAILAVTALVVGVVTSYLLERYVQEETSRFTRDAVASHFGTIFTDEVFERPLDAEEWEDLERTVAFHLSVYSAIPLGARIFAVGDSFDAMTSDRPCRRAISVAEARAEVERCRGTQFDPAVVEAFLRIPVAHLEAIADDAPHTHPRSEAV